jgi:hypothetical protein
MIRRIFGSRNGARESQNALRSPGDAKDDFAGLVLGYSRTGPFVGNFLMGVDFSQLDLAEFPDDAFSWTWLCQPPPAGEVPPAFSATDEIEFAETRVDMDEIVRSWSPVWAPTGLIARAAPLLFDEFRWNDGSLSLREEALATHPIKLRTRSSLRAVAHVLGSSGVERSSVGDVQRQLQDVGFTLRLVPAAGVLSYRSVASNVESQHSVREIADPVMLSKALWKLHDDLFLSGYRLALTRSDALPVNDLAPPDPWVEFTVWQTLKQEGLDW